MADDMPLISIIIPCYNRERYIKEAILSATNQSYENKEIIVVDDGSTDSSWSIISSFGAKIVAIKQENGGVSAARNRGLEIAGGEYIVFLDSDDRLEPDALDQFIANLPSDPNAILVGRHIYIDEQGEKLSKPAQFLTCLAPNVPASPLEVISGWTWNWSALIPAHLICRAGRYDAKLSLAEDYDLNLRMLDVGAVFVPFDRTTYQWRDHEELRLTKNVPQEKFEQIFRLFQRGWLSQKAAFTLPESEKHRLRFARWIWYTGRNCYRIGYRDTGDRMTNLAFQIAGRQARNGSLIIQICYVIIAPFYVEVLSEAAKKCNGACGNLFRAIQTRCWSSIAA